MVKALSVDLRTRVLAAVAARIGVSAAGAGRWRALARRLGDARPGPLGGDRRSGRIEVQAPLIHQLLDATADITSEERGRAVGYGTIQRFFHRHTITRKKGRPRRASKTVPTS